MRLRSSPGRLRSRQELVAGVGVELGCSLGCWVKFENCCGMGCWVKFENCCGMSNWVKVENGCGIGSCVEDSSTAFKSCMVVSMLSIRSLRSATAFELDTFRFLSGGGDSVGLYGRGALAIFTSFGGGVVKSLSLPVSFARRSR